MCIRERNEIVYPDARSEKPADASAIAGEDIMHLLFIFGVLLHATALAVIGFFVLFAAERATGRVNSIGKLLGGWLFVLAALVLLCGIFVVATGRIPGRGMWAHHGAMGGYQRGAMMAGPPAASPPEQGPANSSAPAGQ
jgi:hypothetical protein